MKSSISLILLVICTVVLAAKESQAKKGCNAYGHACYGGHGKRSLGSLVGGATVGNEQDELRADAVLQVLPNEILAESELDAVPRYRLIKIMKSWLGGHQRRPSERLSEMDYPISGESTFNRESSNIFQ